jgi:dUTP pyrophosphatase
MDPGVLMCGLIVAVVCFWVSFANTDTVQTPKKYDCALEVKKLKPEGKIPTKNRPTDAAWDIYSAENKKIYADTVERIDIGLAISPPPGWYFTVDGRSGMTGKGIRVLRGIIDTGYTGPVGVVIANLSDKAYEVKIGDRIGQLVPHKTYNIDFREVEEFSPEYAQRGDAGWGSSGS